MQNPGLLGCDVALLGDSWHFKKHVAFTFKSMQQLLTHFYRI
jgi:hypothetical protein